VSGQILKMGKEIDDILCQLSEREILELEADLSLACVAHVDHSKLSISNRKTELEERMKKAEIEAKAVNETKTRIRNRKKSKFSISFEEAEPEMGKGESEVVKSNKIEENQRLTLQQMNELNEMLSTGSTKLNPFREMEKCKFKKSPNSEEKAKKRKRIRFTSRTYK